MEAGPTFVNINLNPYTRIYWGNGDGYSGASSRKKRARRLAALLGDSSHKTYSVMTIGDVKHGFQTADHEGWVMLDGRLTTALPPSQQATAASLGIGSVLPNATGKYLSQTGEALGTTTSSNDATITQTHLPEVTLTATTTQGGGHAEIQGGNTARVSAWDHGNTNVYVASVSASSTPDHDHDISIPLNPSTQLALDKRPATISANVFIYLGA